MRDMMRDMTRDTSFVVRRSSFNTQAPDMTSSQPRAVLWDMDGTLLDSASLHWLAWHDTLAAAGRPTDTTYFVATFGQRNDTILRGLLGPEVSESEITQLSDAKEAHYRELVRTQGIALFPGVRTWLATLQAAGWRQAVASSAPRLNIETILEATGIAAFFAATASAEDVQRGKPDPQVFLLAADRLGAPRERCVVVEDSPYGIEAARRAGMKSVAVGTAYATLPADLAAALPADLPADAFERFVTGDGWAVETAATILSP
jgi:beta-phosphoglucomutase